jgi:predicted Zn-dependent protease
MRLTASLIALCFVLLGNCSASSPQAFASATDGEPADYSRAEALVREHRWEDGLAVLAPLLKREPHNLKALNLAGLALIGKGDPTEADEYFRQCLAVDPTFVPALKNLSINEFNRHEFELAEKHLLAAVKESPDDPIANLYLGEIYYGKHQYEPAANNFRRAGALLSRDSNVAAHLAISYLRSGQKQKALDVLDRLEPAQLSPQSQFALGLALAQLDLPERSLPYMQAAYQSYPDSYDIGFDLTVGFIQARNYPQAIAAAKELAQREHETSELDNVLAEAYEGNKETQHAVEALRRAISLDPDSEDNYLDFASLCMNHGSFDDGLKVISVGLQAHPKSDRLIFLRGILFAMEDHFPLAEKDFQLATSLAPDKNLGYVGLGVAYIETGDTKQAIQVLRQRIRERPDDANLLYLLGEAILHSGAQPSDKEYVEAQTSLEGSVRLNPTLCLPHVSLGTIYLDQDRLQDAVAQFEQARLLDPNEKSAYSHLAIAYRRLGQTDKAREVLTSLKDILDQQRIGKREGIKTPSEAASEHGSTTKQR